VEGGHSKGEAGGSSAHELSQVDEYLLVRAEGCRGGQVRDSLEETRSVPGEQEARQDGVFKALGSLRTVRTGSGRIRIVPGGVGCKVALSRVQLFDSHCDELPKSNERKRTGQEGVGVVQRGQIGGPIG